MIRRWRAPALQLLAAAPALAILVAAAWLSTAHSQRWQWSHSGAASLNEASQALATKLDDPVTLTVALPEGHLLRQHVRDLGKAYARPSAGFRVRFVDPARQPDRARKLGLVRTGEGLLQYGDRAERIKTPSEARISSALERLLRRGERYVAFLTGHGERDLLGNANFDLGRFGEALARKGYQLQPLALAAAAVVPDNASVLVVAAPVKALLPGEIEAIRDYLKRGGVLLWLGEPGGVGPSRVLPVRVGDKPVTDPRSAQMLGIDDPRFLLLERPPLHRITRGLEAPLLLVQAAPVQMSDDEGGAWQATPLLQSPRRSDGTAPTSTSLAITLRCEATGGRAVVIGDADLFANSYLGNGDNLRFGLRLVDWLTGAEDFMSTYMSAAPDQRLELTRPGTVVLAMGLLVGLPGALTLAGSLAWRRLRRG